MQFYKPIIIAICGKSASGKDTLAHELVCALENEKIPVQYIVSDTTRPPRVAEQNGIDYNFISHFNFIQNQRAKLYLENSYFRGWQYGTHKNSISKSKINVGVFNPDGIKSLRRYRQNLLIIPVYLEEDVIIRLRRSYNREGKFKFEFLRRAFVDWRAFKNINSILKNFGYYIKLTDERTVMVKISKVLYMLEYWGIINCFGQKTFNTI